MKNNLLFLIVLISLLLIGLGALFYVYNIEDTSSNLEPVTQEEVWIEDDSDFADQDELIDQQLEAQGEVSDDDSLETIFQELENTIILEEDLGDL